MMLSFRQKILHSFDQQHSLPKSMFLPTDTVNSAVHANSVETLKVSTGSMLEWFKQRFAPAASLAELDAEAAKAPVGAGGIIVLDTWQGSRTPYADGKARGAVWGMSLATTRGDLFRAFLEGIAYGSRAMVEAAATVSGGQPPSRVAVVGGATRSPFFLQLLADVVGVPLVTVGAGAAACAVGAAVVATAGFTSESLATVSRRFVKDDVTFTPDPVKHAAYQFYFGQHQQTYARLKVGMHEMDAHLLGRGGGDALQQAHTVQQAIASVVHVPSTVQHPDHHHEPHAAPTMPANNYRQLDMDMDSHATRLTVRCAFSDTNLHSRMPLDPTHVRLKRTRV
jgi:hypothetical protein